MPDGDYVVHVSGGQAAGQSAIPVETYLADHGAAGGGLNISGLVLWGVILTIIVVAAFTSFFTVNQQSFRVVQRLGKFKKIAAAGLNFKMPFIDRVSDEVSLKIQQLDNDVAAKSKDNAFLSIPVKVQYQVIPARAKDAYYTLSNAKEQIQAYVINIVRSCTSTMDMQEVFESKNTIEAEVRTSLNEKFTGFGYEIVNVLVDNPLPSEQVRKSFDAVISSQRLREAAQNEAEAIRVKTVGLAKADAEALVLKATAYKEQRAIMTGVFENLDPVMRSILIGIDYRDMVRDSAARGSTVLVVPSAEAGNDIGKILPALAASIPVKQA